MSDIDIRHGFLSPDWLAMAARETQAALDASPVRATLALKVVERFFDPPAGAWVPETGEPGFVLEIASGKVEMRGAVLPGDHGEYELDCPWVDAWRGSSMPHGPELDAFNLWRADAGRLTIRGALPAEAAFLGKVHDHLADHTVAPDASLIPGYPA